MSTGVCNGSQRVQTRIFCTQGNVISMHTWSMSYKKYHASSWLQVAASLVLGILKSGSHMKVGSPATSTTVSALCTEPSHHEVCVVTRGEQDTHRIFVSEQAPENTQGKLSFGNVPIDFITSVLFPSSCWRRQQMRIPVQTRGYLQHSKRQPVPRSSHSALCHGLWWRAHWMPVGLAVHVMLCSEQTRQTCCLLCWEWKWNYSRLSATNVMVLNALPWQRVGVPGTRGYVHFSPPHNARIISCSQKIL